MGVMIFIGAAIVVCFALIGFSVWGVMTKKYEDGDALDKIQHLSDLSAELAETAVIYKQIGMDQEAKEAAEESDRLNTMVWEVINGSNRT